MKFDSDPLRILITLALAVVACERKSGTVASGGSVSIAPRVAIDEIMANPRVVPDDRGEWLELHNLEQLPSDGFFVCCFPVNIRAASAGWTRAVAIFDDALMKSATM